MERYIPIEKRELMEAYSQYGECFVTTFRLVSDRVSVDFVPSRLRERGVVYQHDTGLLMEVVKDLYNPYPNSKAGIDGQYFKMAMSRETIEGDMIFNGKFLLHVVECVNIKKLI